MFASFVLLLPTTMMERGRRDGASNSLARGSFVYGTFSPSLPFQHR